MKKFKNQLLSFYISNVCKRVAFGGGGGRLVYIHPYCKTNEVYVCTESSFIDTMCGHIKIEK